MADLFDHLVMSNNDVTYPIVESEYNLINRDPKPKNRIVDRVQVQFGEMRFAFLLRHPTSHHWCGFVRIDPLVFVAIEKIVRPVISPRISFLDYGNDLITWMRANARGQLKQPVNIIPTPDSRGDYWVGFHLRIGDPYPNVQDALNHLFIFEKTISTAVTAHDSASRR